MEAKVEENIPKEPASSIVVVSKKIQINTI